MYAAGWLLTLAGGIGLVGVILALRNGILHDGAAFFTLETALAALSAGLLAGALAQSHQRRADGWQDYFGPSPFLLVAAWLAISTLLGEGIAGLFDYTGTMIPTSAQTLLLLVVNLQAYLIIVELTVIGTGAMTWTDLARPRRLAPDPGDFGFDWRTYAWTGPTERHGPRATANDLLLGFALGLPLMIGTLVLIAILTTILGLQHVPNPGPIPTYLPDWDIWIYLVAAAIVAPIGEEIFFRGMATNAWARSLPRNQAILRGAVVFASIHLINIIDGSVLGDAFLFTRLAILAVSGRILVAWALSWIYTRRRSIYASFALHATYNASLIALAWWVGQTIQP
jgi:membrane protease YdiL (CAAX protease family)